MTTIGSIASATIVLYLAACSAGAQSADQAASLNLQAVQLHKQALQLLEQKNYKQANDAKAQAIALYRKAIEADPRMWEPYLNLGDILQVNTSSAESYLQAAGMYEKALSIRPNDAGMYNRLGNAWWSGGKTAEAIAAMQQAARLDPQNATYVYNVGFMHANSGDFDKARQVHAALQGLNAQKSQQLLDAIRHASGESSLIGRPATYGNPKIELIRIEPGTAAIGNKAAVTRAYYLGKYPVTQAQWQLVMGDNPSFFKDCGGNCPVEQVSWNDAQAFVTRLNQLNDGYRYRLPSDAEWEYAYVAGGKEGPPLSGDFGWNSDNSAGKTHPVGGKKPNAFGLYDMNGHVQEWCADMKDDNRMFRIMRGMSFYTKYTVILTNRFAKHVEDRSRNHGFRVAAEKARP